MYSNTVHKHIRYMYIYIQICMCISLYITSCSGLALDLLVSSNSKKDREVRNRWICWSCPPQNYRKSPWKSVGFIPSELIYRSIILKMVDFRSASLSFHRFF